MTSQAQGKHDSKGFPRLKSVSEFGSRDQARVGSKEWANRQLRFSIRILKGEICRQSWDSRLQLALYVKDRLLRYGFTWQARRIDNWIHRLQPRRADPGRGAGGVS